MAKKRDMPKKKEIFKHWQKKLECSSKFWMDDEAAESCTKNEFEKLDTCFACGSKARTQRCHILPKCEGGTDEIDNLHLLCEFCHTESEYFSGELYNEWFEFKNPTNSLMNKMHLNKIDLFKGLINDNKAHLLPNWFKKNFNHLI